jgi:hypothetical protein
MSVDPVAALVAFDAAHVAHDVNAVATLMARHVIYAMGHMK